MKFSSGILKFIVRFGYFAKGAVYLAVGLLALEVAVGFGSQTGDTKGALEEIGRRSWLAALFGVEVRRGVQEPRQRRKRPQVVVRCQWAPPYLSRIYGGENSPVEVRHDGKGEEWGPIRTVGD